MPPQWLLATAWLSAMATQGWKDRNSVTFKEADSIDLPPFPRGSPGIFKKERKVL